MNVTEIQYLVLRKTDLTPENMIALGQQGFAATDDHDLLVFSRHAPSAEPPKDIVEPDVVEPDGIPVDTPKTRQNGDAPPL